MRISESNLGGPPRKVGVVAARFNQTITDRLVSGACAALEDEGVEEVTVFRVPGALELGVVAAALLRADWDAVVAIGAVIKGETDHYEYVAAEASAALSRVALDTGKPVGNALLTVRDPVHAEERALAGPSNKGDEAARAAVDAYRVLAAVRAAGSQDG